ncbi:Uncharacterised protein [Chromobacterium violaceum]|uniref:Uncharacterized protein n=1 Tax=Chromobacterium violaceum TaxID=536 RepID=A0A447TBE3_CHRVL|nr:Uncharacterised protein [Chromobacterium violaceum]
MAGAIIVLSHLIGPKKELAAVLPGVAMVLGICFASRLLNRWLPLKIPTLIWLSILGVLASLPACPAASGATSASARSMCWLARRWCWPMPAWPSRGARRPFSSAMASACW